jgi:two-component system response regulator PilR (NtrC family)
MPWAPAPMQAFVAVNCGAIPENLMESEFFGYRKGAFTGADSDRDGFFQAADGGTLFLDEVVDLPLRCRSSCCARSRKSVCARSGHRRGSRRCAHHLRHPPGSQGTWSSKGAFRQDLFYRLNVIELRMPALRECREDIPALAGPDGGRVTSMSTI